MANERNEFTVLVNGIDLFYEVAGDGEPLLLLHGGGGTHENWTYAGRDPFLREYKLIAPDAQGHGRSTNPQRTITHRQCALDTLALLDHLGIPRCRAIGVSMGGHILLHMATLQPDRIEAMVAVSCTKYFPASPRNYAAGPGRKSAAQRVGNYAQAPHARRRPDRGPMGMAARHERQL